MFLVALLEWLKINFCLLNECMILADSLFLFHMWTFTLCFLWWMYSILHANLTNRITVQYKVIAFNRHWKCTRYLLAEASNLPARKMKLSALPSSVRSRKMHWVRSLMQESMNEILWPPMQEGTGISVSVLSRVPAWRSIFHISLWPVD